MRSKEHYIYCYYDSDKIPIYIGIGKGNRYKQHMWKSKRKGRESMMQLLL